MKTTLENCGANAPGGGGFQPGNKCAGTGGAAAPTKRSGKRWNLKDAQAALAKKGHSIQGAAPFTAGQTQTRYKVKQPNGKVVVMTTDQIQGLLDDDAPKGSAKHKSDFQKAYRGALRKLVGLEENDVSTIDIAQRVQLLERATFQSGRVDRAAGIIYGAKLVGVTSKNKARVMGLDATVFGDALDHEYSYSAQALRDAVGLYEGCALKVQHPKFTLGQDGRRIVEPDERGPLETVGVVKNVRAERDGLRGDLHLFLTHTLTPRILEMAEKAPTQIMLSHNAQGEPRLRGRRVVIEKIYNVNSVDLVSKGGTTVSLFEGLLEMESDRMMPDEKTIDDVLREIIAIIKNHELSADEKIEAMAAMVAPDLAESFALEREVRAQSTARAMLETARVEATDVRVAALAAMGDDGQRQALLEEFRGQELASRRPRFSVSPHEEYKGLRDVFPRRRGGSELPSGSDFIRALKGS